MVWSTFGDEESRGKKADLKAERGEEEGDDETFEGGKKSTQEDKNGADD